MKIAIYTLFRPIFGRLCESWRKVFISRGISCKVVTLDREFRGVLPAPTGTDIHLYMGGLSMLKFLSGQSSWLSGRHVLWLFEALTNNADSIFSKQTQCMVECCNHLNLVLAMDHLVKEYLSRSVPAMQVVEVPFMIAEEHIRSPLLDSSRMIDVLMLGRKSTRRECAETLFSQRDVKAMFIYDGQYGDERYDLWAKSRVNINVHRDDHFYFDRVRTFEAWAAGTPVISEQWGEMPVNGIIEGKHIITSTLENMPDACASLLADVERRKAMVVASQSLLLNHFTPEKWSNIMMKLLDNL